MAAVSNWFDRAASSIADGNAIVGKWREIADIRKKLFESECKDGAAVKAMAAEVVLQSKGMAYTLPLPPPQPRPSVSLAASAPPTPVDSSLQAKETLPRPQHPPGCGLDTS